MGLVDPLVPRVRASTSTTCSCFGGSSAATFSLVRRSISGRIRRRSWCEPDRVAVALDRPAVVLGEPVRMREQPGRGDGQQRPQVHQAVLQRRAGDGQLERRLIRRAHWYVFARWFFTNWASSRISPDQSSSTRSSMSIRSSAYEVTTTSAPADRLTPSATPRLPLGLGQATRPCRPGAKRAASLTQLRHHAGRRDHQERRRRPGCSARRGRSARGPAASCPGPCRRRGCRRARARAGSRASGSRRAGTAAARPAASAGAGTGSIDVDIAQAAGRPRPAADWSITTPRARPGRPRGWPGTVDRQLGPVASCERPDSWIRSRSRGELGSVELEVDAGLQDQVVLAGGERDEELVERHGLTVHRHREVQVEPVRRVPAFRPPTPRSPARTRFAGSPRPHRPG